jgi:hypothetical protein
VIATSEGDASRFRQINVEYAKAPEVTRSRMYLETMQQVYSNTSKVLVDTKGQGNLLYLPLDKLMQAAGAVAAAPPAGSPEVPVAARPSRRFPTRCRRRWSRRTKRVRARRCGSVIGRPADESRNECLCRHFRGRAGGAGGDHLYG